MNKTLQFYISRDLVKVTAMALVAFTLQVTIFAIIEPMRKQQGMSPMQVVGLFFYTMPVMLSLTMPVAALFASTIVYGRFSQDNEFLACRASGVSTLSLLRPAWALGLLVTAVSLVLANFVAPQMIMNSKVIQKNLKSVSYRALQTKGALQVPGQPILIHADVVNEKADRLEGVVVAHTGDGDNTSFLVASRAHLKFETRPGSADPVLAAYLENPSVSQGSARAILVEDSQVFQREITNPIKGSPAWLDWPGLLETTKKPFLDPGIAKELERIKQEIAHYMVLTQAQEAIKAGHRYDSLCNDPSLPPEQRTTYSIRAATTKVKMTPPKESRHERPSLEFFGDEKHPLTLVVTESGKETVITGGKLATLVMEARLNEVAQASQVTLVFGRNLRSVVKDRSASSRPATGSSMPATAGAEAGRLSEFEVGELPIPQDVTAILSNYTLEDIDRQGRRLLPNSQADTDDGNRKADLPVSPQISKDLVNVCGPRTHSLRSAIFAEMNSRVAYSASCLLMVTLGAALGLMFRGGQFITAFAITAVPGTFVICMTILGKGLLETTHVDQKWGLLSIWGGIVLLLVGNIVIHMRLARR